jgi:hypothetical protein
MKTLATLFILLLITISAFSQIPGAFKYQALLRDKEGNALMEQKVSLRIKVLDARSEHTSIYAESHHVETNNYGLIHLEIGRGESDQHFSDINWGEGPYFLKIEVDPSGGDQYESLGTSELLSVPYSLHAKTAENSFSGRYQDLKNKPDLSDIVRQEQDPLFNSSVASGITKEDTIKWNHKLQKEMDGDPFNEIQHMSLSNDTLYLDQANSIKLPDSIFFAHTSHKSVRADSASTSTTFDRLKKKGDAHCSKENEGILRYNSEAKSVEYCNGTKWETLLKEEKTSPPEVKTKPLSSISTNSAISGGIIQNHEKANIIQVGLCWNTDKHPTIHDNIKSQAFTDSSYTLTFNNLLSNEKYYIRSFTIGQSGTIYGDEISFTTLPNVISTDDSKFISFTSFETGGTVDEGGGEEILERGIAYSYEPNPTRAGSIKAGNGAGHFTTTISGLIETTGYFFKAYAVNAGGVSYGPMKEFLNIIYTGNHFIQVFPKDLPPNLPWHEPHLEYSFVDAVNENDGQINTEKIVNKLGPGYYAAYLCDTLNAYGYEDWYLPAINELEAIIPKKNTLYGFKPAYYWSSTEIITIDGALGAEKGDFRDANFFEPHRNYKEVYHQVRCVRKIEL